MLLFGRKKKIYNCGKEKREKRTASRNRRNGWRKTEDRNSSWKTR